MTADLSPPRAKDYFFLFLIALAFHLAGTWILPLMDRDEPRFAEASREMLERRDYVVPYFNNQYRFDKPPLTYWLQTTSYRLFGENELAARLPSVLAAAGVAVILLAWGSRLRNAAFGWRAAIIFSLSLQVVLHAKAAVADMLLVLFVCLAAWAGWEMLRENDKKSPASRWWWVYFGALVLGFLAKGPISWLPLVPVGVALAKNERWSYRLWFTLGIVVTIGAIGLWGIPALKATDGKFFEIGIGKHVVGRSISTMEGHGANDWLGYAGTLPLYFITVFASFCPWSWFLPRLIRQRRVVWQTSDLRYLAVLVLIYFGVFSLVKTKLPHYTLPAFPMLALLVAEFTSTLQIRKIGAVTGGLLLLLFFVGFPFSARLFPSPSLASLSKKFLKPEMEFASTEFVEPSLAWSFRKYVHGFHFPNVPPEKAAKWMQKSGPRFYILPTEKVGQAFPSLDPSWKTFRHQGLNFAKAKPTDLTMLVKPD